MNFEIGNTEKHALVRALDAEISRGNAGRTNWFCFKRGAEAFENSLERKWEGVVVGVSVSVLDCGLLGLNEKVSFEIDRSFQKNSSESRKFSDAVNEAISIMNHRFDRNESLMTAAMNGKNSQSSLQQIFRSLTTWTRNINIIIEIG